MTSLSEYIKKVAHYIPDQDKMLMILQFCDIDFGNIKLNGAPLPTWNMIFTEAYGQNKTDSLVEELGKQYEDLKISDEELLTFKHVLEPGDLVNLVRIPKNYKRLVIRIMLIIGLCVVAFLYWIGLMVQNQTFPAKLSVEKVNKDLGLQYAYVYKAKDSIYDLKDFLSKHVDLLLNKSEDYFIENYLSDDRKKIESHVLVSAIQSDERWVELKFFPPAGDTSIYAAFVITMDSAILLNHYLNRVNSKDWILFGEGVSNELFYRGDIRDTMKIVLNLNYREL